MITSIIQAQMSVQKAQLALKTPIVANIRVNDLRTEIYPKPNFDRGISLANYQHWYEGNAPKGKSPNGVKYTDMKLCIRGCAPSTYLMARALIDPDFKVSIEKYKNALDGMGNDRTGTSMDKIGIYAQTQLGDTHYELQQSSDREKAKTAIQMILDKDKHIIINVLVKKTSIVEKGGENHVVVIYGLTQSPSGGTAYYLDPLEKAPEKGRKIIDYTKFLI